MNKHQFVNILSHLPTLNSNDATELKAITDSFPFFGTARLLYAKALHTTGSIHYNNVLKETAVHASSRKVLHRIISQTIKEQKATFALNAKELTEVETQSPEVKFVERKSINEEERVIENIEKIEVENLPKIIEVKINEEINDKELLWNPNRFKLSD